MRLLTLTCIFLACSAVAYGARIVLLYPLCTKSHFYVIKPAIEILAERGHKITVFSPYKGISSGIQNASEILLPETAAAFEDYPVDWFAMQKRGFFQHLEMLHSFMTEAPKLASELLKNKEFKRIIDERDVDLFIVDGFGNEFTYPIIELSGAPFITSSATIVMPMLLPSLGVLPEYAYAPGTGVDATNHMSFFERLQNTLLPETVKLVREYLIFKSLDDEVRKEFPQAKPIAEVDGSASISFFNSHTTYAYPRSLPPNIIYVPAMHTRPAKVLSEPFKAFADEATDGFIVFSLGSFISTSSMPQEAVETFVKVFSQLPYKVIWKWEGQSPEGVPKNVMMAPWIPQQDLLGHPNSRLLISHGGLLGTQEAIYNGVPFISLPFGNDQKTVTRKSREEGYAIQLDWSSLNDAELLDSIKHLIEDPKVRASAKKASNLLRDNVVPTVDIAVYWIEYVLRHGEPKHLQLASKTMPFYQRHLLDVIGSLLLLFVTVTYAFYRFVCFLLKKSCGPKNQTNVSANKTKIN